MSELAKCQAHICATNASMCGWLSAYSFDQIIALETHKGRTWATYVSTQLENSCGSKPERWCFPWAPLARLHVPRARMGVGRTWRWEHELELTATHESLAGHLSFNERYYTIHKIIAGLLDM